MNEEEEPHYGGTVKEMKPHILPDGRVEIVWLTERGEYTSPPMTPEELDEFTKQLRKAAFKALENRM